MVILRPAPPAAFILAPTVIPLLAIKVSVGALAPLYALVIVEFTIMLPSEVLPVPAVAWLILPPVTDEDTPAPPVVIVTLVPFPNAALIALARTTESPAVYGVELELISTLAGSSNHEPAWIFTPADFRYSPEVSTKPPLALSVAPLTSVVADKMPVLASLPMTIWPPVLLALVLLAVIEPLTLMAPASANKVTPPA